MSDNYLDYVGDDEEPPVDRGLTEYGLYGWAGGMIAMYLLASSITIAIVGGLVVAALVVGVLLALPGESSIDLDGVTYGAPGEWGLLDDEEESE